MHPECLPPAQQAAARWLQSLSAGQSPVWQSLALLQWPQQVCVLGRCCACCPCSYRHGAGAEEGAGLSGQGQLQVLLRALCRCCATLPRGDHSWAGSPMPSAAAIEGLCVSWHKVRIDAVSPPPALPAGLQMAPTKVPFFPRSGQGASGLRGRHQAAAWSTHPSFCAGAGDPLALSLAQAELAAAQVPARAAGPPSTGPSMVRQPGQCSAAGTSSGHVWGELKAPCEQICFPAVPLQLGGSLLWCS